MQRLTNERWTEDRVLYGTNGETPSPRFCEGYARSLLLLLLAATVTLSACGGGASGGSQQSATLSGNWQFTMAPQTDGNPSDPTFNGGLLGGFLVLNNGLVSGQTVYSVAAAPTPSNPSPLPCNSGSAPVAVTISGQKVTLTEVAGTQTYTLTGTLSSDGSTMMGTYTSTAGTASDGVTPCGYAETGSSWSAVSVPPLTGTITGSFHSTSGNSGLDNQDFAVSGTFTQGENIGASSATITGTLSFIDPVTNLSDYPCFSVASVNGQISGNSVMLQIIGTSGLTVGQIGEPSTLLSLTGINPVTFDSVQGGNILHGLQPTYMVETGACPGGGSLGDTTLAGDSGNICLALNSTTACQQPITLSPYAVTFPAQMLGTAATTQTIALANNSNSPLNGLTLSFTYQKGSPFGGYTDFNGLPSFTETDACGAGGAPSQGEPFNLGSGQSCSITATFSQQESCPWLPFPASGNPQSISGAAPEYCPFPQTATVTVNNVPSADPETFFAVPITGIGLSAIQPSTPELDFGAEEQLSPPEASLPQTLSFTNYSANPVQILPRVPCVDGFLPHSGIQQRPVSSNSGLQVVCNGSGCNVSISAEFGTIQYDCDSDPGTSQPNFQISSDTCSGATLDLQASCSLQIAYVPQPKTDVNGGLDYFLELNTEQCWSNGVPTLPSPTNPCEIDSGRFPVELKANTPSPLRMLPGAGLDFGNQKKGSTSAPLTITLLNDPALTTTQTVTFLGNIQVSGNTTSCSTTSSTANYSIPTGGNSCPATLAPGGSCTVSVVFTPGSVGFDPGKLVINYTQQPSSGPATTGNPQCVYLRGTGQ